MAETFERGVKTVCFVIMSTIARRVGTFVVLKNCSLHVNGKTDLLVRPENFRVFFQGCNIE